jgi:GMP synthase-like glutamine amidotransferase
MHPARILVLQIDPIESMGIYPEILRGLGAEVTIFHAYRLQPPEKYPSIDGFDAFILSAMAPDVHEMPRFYFLQQLWDYVDEIRLSGKPCFGICGGAQFLAYRLGANVHSSPKEVGCYRIQLTEAGIRDPLLEGIPQEFTAFLWHGNMFEIPKDGELVATGEPCHIQGFRFNNIRGFLFRFELNSRELGSWLEVWGSSTAVAGKTPEQVLSECKLNDAQMRLYAERVAANLIHLVSQ